MSNCIECFGTPKSNCLLPRCPYRRRQLDNALDCLTAETDPDPLEEMATRTPGKRLVATGNRDRFTAIDGGWFGRQAR